MYYRKVKEMTKLERKNNGGNREKKEIRKKQNCHKHGME